MNLFKSIGAFFTETVPSWAQTNWAVIQLVLLGLVVGLLIALVVVSIAKHRDHVRSSGLIRDWVGKNTERVKQLEAKETECKELNEKYINAKSECKTLEEVSAERVENVRRELTEKYDQLVISTDEKITNLNKDLDTAKEVIADREMSLAGLTQECQDKNATIANMTIDKDRMSAELLEKTEKIDLLIREKTELRAELDLSETNYGNLKYEHDVLDEEFTKLENEKTELEKSFVALSEKHSELEGRHKDALNRIDYLENFELENEILLKTLRTFKKDEEATQVDTKAAIHDLEERLNAKMEGIFDAMTAKLMTANARKAKVDFDAIDDMGRNQLSKVAKQVGIKNFATWSNEKLREEIKKYR